MEPRTLEICPQHSLFRDRKPEHRRNQDGPTSDPAAALALEFGFRFGRLFGGNHFALQHGSLRFRQDAIQVPRPYLAITAYPADVPSGTRVDRLLYNS